MIPKLTSFAHCRAPRLYSQLTAGVPLGTTFRFPHIVTSLSNVREQNYFSFRAAAAAAKKERMLMHEIFV